jgi:hypothetical protein
MDYIKKNNLNKKLKEIIKAAIAAWWRWVDSETEDLDREDLEFSIEEIGAKYGINFILQDKVKSVPNGLLNDTLTIILPFYDDGEDYRPLLKFHPTSFSLPIPEIKNTETIRWMRDNNDEVLEDLDIDRVDEDVANWLYNNLC